MLVLSRNEGQDIIITPVDDNGNNLKPITIRLVSSERGRSKIGIDAPREYPVNRREIQETIDKNQKEAKVFVTNG